MATTTVTATQTLERAGHTGLSDSTHSSSSSAEKYSLDEFDTRPILLYQYRGRLRTSSQKDLCAWLDKDQHLRLTRKPLPRFCGHVDIRRHDLYLPSERATYRKFPNYDSSLAFITIPTLAYWSRMFFGNFHELYIVSPENSPNASEHGDSDRCSPTDTSERRWADEVDAKLGALKSQEEGDVKEGGEEEGRD